MELNLYPIRPEEIVCMGGLSSRGLDQKIGCIGSLTANLNTGTPEFESAWRSRTFRLNTPEFTDEFNEMIGTLRQGILKSPAELRACCAACPDSILKDSPSADIRHGFRIDTGRYSYMLVCSFRSADCRLWLNAFSFLALDRHMREARSGIPILDQQGHERFRMPDGGKLRVTSQDGFSGFCTVRYFDKERAVLFDELHESIILPIRELPEWEAANKFRLLPLDPPMRSSREPYRKGQER